MIYRLAENSNFILKALVRASQTMRVEHKAWVGIAKTGTVITAHCTCMAGLSCVYITD